MHGDPAPPGGFQRLTAALPTPFSACFLGCAKAWRVCGQRANCRPGSFRAWGSQRAWGTLTSCTSPCAP